MNRRIKKVAVLGSGVMGSRIACHFANVGIEVLLLDIAPRELLPQEQAKGLTLESAVVRNRIVNYSLETALKTNLSPIYSEHFVKCIHTGDLQEDMLAIAQRDCGIEVVLDRDDI